MQAKAMESKAQFDVIGLGVSVVDVVTLVDHFPAQEEVQPGAPVRRSSLHCLCPWHGAGIAGGGCPPHGLILALS
jgi:hypothetical protein